MFFNNSPWITCTYLIKAVFHSAQKSEQTKNSSMIFLSACAVQTRLCNIIKQRTKTWRKKSWTFSTFLGGFLSWNFNSQADFVLISTFINMASRNEMTREIYPGFSDCAIWNFLFQRLLSAWWESTAASSSTTCRSSRPEVYCRPTFFHRTPLVVASKHEIQAPTLTAGIEQEDKFRGSPDNQNTNEEEENSTKQTTNLQRVN